MEIKRFIGMDISRDKMIVCIREGEKKSFQTVEFDIENKNIEKFKAKLKKTDRVLIEAGTGSIWIAIFLSQCVGNFWMASPNNLAMIAKTNKKTDKIDAKTLALIAEKFDAEDLSLASIPDERQRHLRKLIALREDIQKERVANLNRLSNFFVDNGVFIKGIKPNYKKLFPKIVSRLDDNMAYIANMYFQNVLECDKKIAEIEVRIADQVKNHPEYDNIVPILTSVPGLGLIGIAAILAFVDWERNLAAFPGLHPRVDQSGSINRKCKITKSGPRLLRLVLIEAVWTMVRCKSNNPVFDFYKRLVEVQKKPKGLAAAAAARKLASILMILIERKEFMKGMDQKQVVVKLKRYKLF